MTAPDARPADAGTTVDAFGAVLVDMDGVLVDSRRDVAALWHALAAEAGTELSAQDVRRDVLGCAPEHTVRAVFGHLDVAERRRMLHRVRGAEPDLGFVELPGARTLVRDLHRAGVPLALVTGASRGRAQRVLYALGIEAAFAALVVWGDVVSGKPAPDCYVLAASRLGVDPRRCLVLEDAPAGVTAALAAGASCVGISGDGISGDSGISGDAGGGDELADRGARPVVGTISALRCVRSTRAGVVELTADGERIAILEG